MLSLGIADLWLVESDHVTRILASDWSLQGGLGHRGSIVTRRENILQKIRIGKKKGLFEPEIVANFKMFRCFDCNVSNQSNQNNNFQNIQPWSVPLGELLIEIFQTNVKMAAELWNCFHSFISRYIIENCRGCYEKSVQIRTRRGRYPGR